MIEDSWVGLKTKRDPPKCMACIYMGVCGEGSYQKLFGHPHHSGQLPDNVGDQMISHSSASISQGGHDWRATDKDNGSLQYSSSVEK